MLNIYPQRATNPNDLDKEINIEYHKKNIKLIDYVFKEIDCDVWCAWWTLIEKRKYLKECLCDIYDLSKWKKINWYNLWKITKNGHPHHPLYLKKWLQLEMFDMENYIFSL